ncbi:hypothetical protein PACTADRAFT_75270 [Pachysolen tannophilus NRRL Y-2460]|uniref:RRM domain-containing protein n=1 Tax=Pachysolen tannophilus NRRL Y-2460 TaxID=669874 RepID=A0A1E4TWG2_PACTA|nr:hypothetical protein PACTADRAFT_75270 [Pachysolen tannophilus NRRL Y-2460]
MVQIAVGNLLVGKHIRQGVGLCYNGKAWFSTALKTSVRSSLTAYNIKKEKEEETQTHDGPRAVHNNSHLGNSPKFTRNNPSNLREEDKLLKLLFKSAAKDVEDQVPKLSKFLMDNLDSTSLDYKDSSSLSSELLDIKEAPKNLPRSNLTRFKSNILKFKSRDSLLEHSDFKRIYPMREERVYDIGQKHCLSFDFVKGRHPKNLLSNGYFYLIFASFEEAAVYWLETLGRQLNGTDVTFSFADLNQEFEFFQTPLLKNLEISQFLNLKELDSVDKNKNEFASFIKFHKNKKEQLLKQQKKHDSLQENTELESGQGIGKISSNLNSMPLADHIPLHEQDKVNFEIKRSNCVLLANLPKHVTSEELHDFFWNYDLYPIEEEAIQLLLKNDLMNFNYWLVVFTNIDDAERCVRNLNGRHWYNNENMPLTHVETF